MTTELTIVCYLNQFFGGLGGEEKAGAEPFVVAGAVGSARAVQNALQYCGKVVATVVCGDNYFAENDEEATRRILEFVESYDANVVIAGPAFEAGRYGVACGQVCKASQERLGIVGVTGMFKENPGVDLFSRDVYIVETGDSARGMQDAASRMVNLARKLLTGEEIGKPAVEGYFPRGIVKNERVEKNAAQRAVDMVLARIGGVEHEPELELPKFGRVAPPPAVRDMASARVALVTDGGLVPKGNPDGVESNRATRFCRCSIEGIDSLSAELFEVNHTGYDTRYVDRDPNRLVPVDVLRDLEREGRIGKLSEHIYATAGVATTLENSARIGHGIAEAVSEEGVDAVILTST